jgi:hypothetical protein
MINVNMQIDPLIYAALERLASQDTREPAPTIYTAHIGARFNGQFFRVLEGKIVTIDENGLQKLWNWRTQI